METPTINYRQVRYEKSLTSMNGVAITVKAEIAWNSIEPGKKISSIVFVVTGELQEKGVKYDGTFEFLASVTDLEPIDAAFTLIGRYVESRKAIPSAEKEVFIDINAWLKIGWLDKSEKWNAYLEFTKGDQKLKATFRAFPEINVFRETVLNAIYG